MKIELNKIYQGDALEVLKTFLDESVDCVITSPPYFNLRDYGVDGQIGLEKTYQEYIDKLINIFNEVKRVLKKNGTCFVNLGDSYNSANNSGDKNKELTKSKNFQTTNANQRKGGGQKDICKKSLMLIPERFAIAMVDNRWILRNNLIWVKPNAMPESVEDRWKKSHEYIFFFVKNKNYYFDLDSIRTPHKEVSIKRAEYELGRNAMGLNKSSVGDKSAMYGMPVRQVKLNEKGAVPPDYLLVNTNCSNDDCVSEHFATYPQDLISPLIKAGCPVGGIVLDPFFGSGTTGKAAKYLSRNYIGIELNQKYVKIAEKRLAQKNLF